MHSPILVKRHLNNIVLCYHGCVRTRAEATTFREHFDDWKGSLVKLQQAGYTFVSPSDYLKWYLGQPGAPTGPIACCSIDDGLDSARFIMDWMVEQGIPFSMALISRRQKKHIPEQDFISWENVNAYINTGLCELQTHTYNMHHLGGVAEYDPDTGITTIAPAPVLEAPCWIDDADYTYIKAGDTRYWWDFSHVDGDTFGFPIFGSDPYDDYATPLVSEFTFKAKETLTCSVIRIFCALGRPYGGGYTTQIKIKVNGVLKSNVLMEPYDYGTRKQWKEIEWVPFQMDTPFNIVAGNSYTIQFKTMTAGPACMMMYALPDYSGDFTMNTNSQSLSAGIKGPDYADFPAGHYWPANGCVIVAAGTGHTVSEAEYAAYVTVDLNSATDVITKWLSATWTDHKAVVNEFDTSLTQCTIAGTYGDGSLASTVLKYTAASSIKMEALKLKYNGSIGRRYPCIVNVHIGTSPTGPWTKIGDFMPVWESYGWREFDVDTTYLTGGVDYWFWFETTNQSGNDVYPLTWGTLRDDDISNALLEYGMKTGVCQILLDGPSLSARITLPKESHKWDLYIDLVKVLTFRSNFGTYGVPLPPQPIGGYVSRLAHSDVWQESITTESVTLDWLYTFYADNRVYGNAFLAAVGVVHNAPAMLPKQFVYPFGAFQTTEVDLSLINNISDISATLKTAFIANNLECGFTIYPTRADRFDVLREPDCRCTEWALPRLLVLGSATPQATNNNIAAYCGTLYPDVQHEGVEWQVSMEVDPLGSATLKHSIAALNYIAMDAYFFDGVGGIVKRELNDGGTYIQIDTQVGNFLSGEALTGSISGATGNVLWANNYVGSEVISVYNVIGTFVAEETVTGGTSGATLTTWEGGAIYYADDKLYCKERGVKRTIIINNNLGTGEPDPAISNHIFNNPTVYIPKIVALLVDEDWDGVTMNLEGNNAADKTIATAFFKDLAAAVHAAGKIIHLTAPARSGTDYDIGSEFWFEWCDHNEIIRHVDGMKIMSYTESGPGSPPGPAVLDDIFNKFYDYMILHIEQKFWPRLYVGGHTFGHEWVDPLYPTAAEEVSYHTGIAGAIGLGAEITIDNTDCKWSVPGNSAYSSFGSPMSVTRAARKAAISNFGGVGIWRLDAGDLYEHWPVNPTLGRYRMNDSVEQQFPPEWSWGLEGGPQFRTAMVQVDSGSESRGPAWSNPLWKFKLSRTLFTPEDNDRLKGFFILRKGRAISFRLKDWSDFIANNQNIGVGDGAKVGFQLRKMYAYTDPINSVTSQYYRTIKKPVIGTVLIYVNGTLVTSGVSVDYTTGLLSFTGAVALGAIVTASFEFDVPVRFEEDKLNVSFDKSFGLYSWSSVGFVEVR